MALAGFAYSALVCSSFSRAQKRVIEMGFSDDINTYVMISGSPDLSGRKFHYPSLMFTRYFGGQLSGIHFNFQLPVRHRKPR